MSLHTIVLIGVIALFALAVYARHRAIHDENPRPGYVHPVSCARDSGWCDGQICKGFKSCPNADQTD